MKTNNKKKVISIFATTAIGGAGVVAAVAQGCGPTFNNRSNTQEVLSRLNNTGSMAGNNGTSNIPAMGTQERLFYDLIETTLRSLDDNENPNLTITRIVTQVPNVNIDAAADGTSVTFSPESLIINVNNTTNNSFQFLNTEVLTISGIVYSGDVITSAGTINDNGLVLSNTIEAVRVIRNLNSITNINLPSEGTSEFVVYQFLQTTIRTIAGNENSLITGISVIPSSVSSTEQEDGTTAVNITNGGITISTSGGTDSRFSSTGNGTNIFGIVFSPTNNNNSIVVTAVSSLTNLIAVTDSEIIVDAASGLSTINNGIFPDPGTNTRILFDALALLFESENSTGISALSIIPGLTPSFYSEDGSSLRILAGSLFIEAENNGREYTSTSEIVISNIVVREGQLVSTGDAIFGNGGTFTFVPNSLIPFLEFSKIAFLSPGETPPQNSGELLIYNSILSHIRTLEPNADIVSLGINITGIPSGISPTEITLGANEITVRTTGGSVNFFRNVGSFSISNIVITDGVISDGGTATGLSTDADSSVVMESFLDLNSRTQFNIPDESSNTYRLWQAIENVIGTEYRILAIQIFATNQSLFSIDPTTNALTILQPNIFLVVAEEINGGETKQFFNFNSPMQTGNNRSLTSFENINIQDGNIQGGVTVSNLTETPGNIEQIQIYEALQTLTTYSASNSNVFGIASIVLDELNSTLISNTTFQSFSFDSINLENIVSSMTTPESYTISGINLNSATDSLGGSVTGTFDLSITFRSTPDVVITPSFIQSSSTDIESLIGGDGNNDNVNSFLNYNSGAPFTADSIASELVTAINQFVGTDVRVNNSNAIVRTISVQNSFVISTSNITVGENPNEYTITIGAPSGIMIIVEDSTTSTNIGTFSLDFELIITITDPSTTPSISANNFHVLTYTSV